jgi:PAS domain S-box-containing protein
MFQREFDHTGNVKEFAVWAADFMDNLPVGMYRTTLEGELVFCNWAFARLLGYDEMTTLQDLEVVELFPRKAERGEFIREVLDLGKVEDYSMRLVKRNGDILTCSTTARAVLNDDGQVTYIDGVMSMGEAGQASAATNSTPAATRDSASAYVRVDPNGIVESMNARAADLFGSHAQNGSEPLSLYSLIQDGDTDRLAQLLESAREQEFSLDVIALMDEKGATRQMECRASTSYLSGREYRIDLMCRDVSLTIEKLRQSQDEEKFQGVLEMAGGIAHNMNQPLTVMNNLVHDLGAILPGGDSEVQDKLNRIQQQLYKLNTIAKKVRSVKQYKSIHYLLGEKIVDLDQIS